jgi:LDH2 family malate/lactate/ureidoglycolate dehydrogenase
MKFHAAALQQFGESLLTSSGLAPDRARDVAEILLEGDLLGHTTHGFALLPAYLNSLKENSMEKNGEPQVISDCDSSLTWDGNYLPGPWLVRRAIDEARERLGKHPLVTIVIRRCHHIGCLQAYLKPVTDAGLFILIANSDPHARLVVPHGGTEPRFSPNPLAAGIPTRGEPVLIDISTSSTSHGLCKRRAAAGEKLPGKWLVDRDGIATDDPREMTDGNGGGILPLGGMDLGYKGFALAMLVEALTGALGGHGRADETSRWGGSVFLQIINPEKFGGREAFLRETSFLAQACKESPAPPGKPPVRLPGQSALTRRAGQLANGVELYPTIFPTLIPWAEILKVKLPAGF